MPQKQGPAVHSRSGSPRPCTWRALRSQKPSAIRLSRWCRHTIAGDESQRVGDCPMPRDAEPGRLTPLLLRQRPVDRRIEQAETLRRHQVVCARAVLVLDEELDAQTGGLCALGEFPAFGNVVDHRRLRAVGCSIGGFITGRLEGRRKRCNHLCPRRQMGAQFISRGSR